MGTQSMPGYKGEDVDRLIFIFDEWAERWRQLVHREMELEAGRPVAKVEAIRRVMEQENPDTGKPHSATSAERYVEGDGEYAAYLKNLRDVVLQKNANYSGMEVARYRVQLGIALTRAEGVEA